MNTSETRPIGELLSTGCTWKIGNISNLSTGNYYSEVFVFGGCKWKLKASLCNRNVPALTSGHLGLFLCIADSPTQQGKWSVDAEVSLGVVDQTSKESDKANKKHSFTAQDHCCYGSFICFSTLCCPENRYLVNGTCVVEVGITVQKVVGYMTYPDDSKEEATGGQGSAAAPTKLNLYIGKAVGCHTDQTADESCFPHGLLIRIPHLDHVASGVGDSVLKELRWNGSVRDVKRMTYYFVLQSLYLQGDHKWKNEEWLAGLRDALAISNSDHLVELKRVTSGEYFRTSSSSVMP
ncbi:ubiquitin C-terminal hydrolase 12-like [Nymphaea colorata]|nr:ubiquitin C-terminal hydrolase 12-like [Nymphaea colorata]